MPTTPIIPARFGGAGIGKFNIENILPKINPDNPDSNTTRNVKNLLTYSLVLKFLEFLIN